MARKRKKKNVGTTPNTVKEPWKPKDMSMFKQAIRLSSMDGGTRTLIANILADSNDSSIIAYGDGGAYNKAKYFNHGYNKDPSTNGGGLLGNVSVEIYYRPANANEYENYNTVDRAEGLLSGRRRLAVRKEGNEISFYTTNHPNQKPGLRTNEYGVFTPVNTNA